MVEMRDGREPKEEVIVNYTKSILSLKSLPFFTLFVVLISSLWIEFPS